MLFRWMTAAPSRWLAGVGIALGLCLSGAAAPAVSQNNGAAVLAQVRQYHGELKDMSAVLKVQNENDAVLSDISHDFAEFVKFGFRNLNYYYKSPDKIRMESTATLLHFLKGISIRNGEQKDVYVPAVGVHKKIDIAGQANKKETSLDFGVMTGDLWSIYRIWFVRSERWNGTPVYVVALQPANEPHGGTMIVRLDRATLRVLERERYSMDGVLQQRQEFSNFVHPLSHVWIPTVIKLYNNKNQFGGELVYSKITVNTGLLDSLFRR